MRFRWKYAILALAAAIGLIAADSSDSAKVMMEAAQKKEVVDGDLNGAIKTIRSDCGEVREDGSGNGRDGAGT